MRALIIIAGMLCFMACEENRPVSSKELLQYSLIRSNGLYKQVKKDAAIIDIIYKPSDLILVQKIMNAHYTLPQIDSMKRVLDQYRYFMIKLSQNGKAITSSADSQRLQEATNYLSYYVGKDFKLIQGEDTVHIADFMHMRTFVAATTTNILIAFKYELKESPGRVSILFDDTCFNTGVTKIDFKVEDILAVPQLNMFSVLRGEL